MVAVLEMIIRKELQDLKQNDRIEYLLQRNNLLSYSRAIMISHLLLLLFAAITVISSKEAYLVLGIIMTLITGFLFIFTFKDHVNDMKELDKEFLETEVKE
jgi:positive regulator of sigma E activity